MSSGDPASDAPSAAGVRRTIRTGGQHELEVKKSRFHCALARLETEDDAREFLRRCRARHHDARHHCSAYILDGGQTHKSSDDGEPAGTAGAPILEVLRRRELTATIAVVSRYFGGVLLGAGGLIRAYGSAVSEAIDSVGTVELRPVLVVSAEVDHARAGRLDNELRAAGHIPFAVHYAERVRFDLHIAESGLDALRAWLAELTGGAAELAVTGRDAIEMPV